VSQQKRLAAVLVLNLSMIAALLIVGLSSHSLGVLAAGGDYAADSAAIGLGLLAVFMRERSRGPSRATTFVALVNSLALFVVTLVVAIGAIRRLTSGTPEIHGLPVLVVSAIAALVMLAGAVIVGGDDSQEDLHMRSVLLDTAADAASAGAVAATGAVILIAKGVYWLDSAVALVVALAIGHQALRLMREVIHRLRSQAPLCQAEQASESDDQR
jgi:cobalt-zinc-cadmium efflux system protein